MNRKKKLKQYRKKSEKNTVKSQLFLTQEIKQKNNSKTS